jgi:DNA modification methylase
LKTMPDGSVNCVVTSPPYWGLRDYGIDGQIGQESTPQEFTAKMVSVFREVRRVLKPDGTVWVNIGDSYASQGGPQVAQTKWQVEGASDGQGGGTSRKPNSGLKPKDLIGVPWRLAFALQDDGWWLRGDHVWAKPNGMPESVRDRPGRSHEYVFMLTKSQRYWYDSEAVRTAPKASTVTRLMQDVENQQGSSRANGGAKTNGPMKAVARKTDKQRGHTRRHAGFNDRWDAMEKSEQMAMGANLRSVWWIPPAQCKEAHFAVMPNRVAEICIRAGCPENGLVLDPFNGAGTTGLVALGLNRNYIGIELNPDYIEISHRRIRMAYPLWTNERTA